MSASPPADSPATAAADELDRQLFRLRALCDFSAELSPLAATRNATQRLIEAILLTVMGVFGTGAGCLVLVDRRTRRVFSARRGVAAAGPEPEFEAAEKLLYRGFLATEERRLAPMSVGFIGETEAVFEDPALADALPTAALFTVDEALLGLLALGGRLAPGGSTGADRELLRGLLANGMVFLKNARAFETIQALNAELSAANEDLRRTIAELTEARRQIRLLELAGERLRGFVRREIEQAGRFRPLHALFIVLTAALLGFAFNASSPNGIALLPDASAAAAAEAVEPLELSRMMAEGRAILLDARPAELFSRRHIPGSINIPAALFDVVFPMKVGPALTAERVVAVTGRTFSKRYDLELAGRLLLRHERVKILAGGLAAWEAHGLPVAP